MRIACLVLLALVGAQAQRPPAPDDNRGFEPIFDGKTLNKWDGDTQFWRAENGSLVGETSAERPLKANTFVVWRGGAPKDFELKLEYRINSTNSGVQYRSSELPGAGKWVLKGYQADIDAQNRYTGQIYEERGRGFLALRGLFTRIDPDAKVKQVGSLGDGEALKALIKPGDWNRLHIIARGNTIIQVVNGQVMSMIVDEDVKNRALEGLLGFQLHTGPPMKVEFRNILLKKL
jgi:hypothetical protein